MTERESHEEHSYETVHCDSRRNDCRLLNGAYKLGMQHRIGSLAEGMDADFVILSSNPLDDIHNTADIANVVRRGARGAVAGW
jgi:cytosine/adenosine deaminase-related metal-dependent hydrolase